MFINLAPSAHSIDSPVAPSAQIPRTEQITSMKVRDSGMPEEAYWETLFDAKSAVDGFFKAERNRAPLRILELGCGYGTITVELAKRTTGHVDTIDLEPEMLQRTRNRLSDLGLENASVHQGDFVSDELPTELGDYDVAVLFHIMHMQDPIGLLRRIVPRVRPGGRLAFFHWRPDQETPRGPDIRIRPTLADYHGWASALNLGPPLEIPLRNCPHHYAVEITTPSNVESPN